MDWQTIDTLPEDLTGVVLTDGKTRWFPSIKNSDPVILSWIGWDKQPTHWIRLPSIEFLNQS